MLAPQQAVARTPPRHPTLNVRCAASVDSHPDRPGPRQPDDSSDGAPRSLRQGVADVHRHLVEALPPPHPPSTRPDRGTSGVGTGHASAWAATLRNRWRLRYALHSTRKDASGLPRLLMRARLEKAQRLETDA